MKPLAAGERVSYGLRSHGRARHDGRHAPDRLRRRRAPRLGLEGQEVLDRRPPPPDDRRRHHGPGAGGPRARQRRAGR